MIYFSGRSMIIWSNTANWSWNQGFAALTLSDVLRIDLVWEKSIQLSVLGPKLRGPTPTTPQFSPIASNWIDFLRSVLFEENQNNLASRVYNQGPHCPCLVDFFRIKLILDKWYNWGGGSQNRAPNHLQLYLKTFGRSDRNPRIHGAGRKY